jgi:hypothetical protein
MDRTNAERQRRFIAKLKAAAAQSKPGVTNAGETAKLKARIAKLEAELARERAKPAAKSAQLTRSHRREAGEVPPFMRVPEHFSEIGKLKAQNGALKSDVAKLKAALQQDPDTAKLRQKVIDQRTEIASMRAAMKRIAKERDQYQTHVARARPRKYGEARGLLTRQNYGILIKALHSDRMKQCTAAELAEAERVATALRPLFDEFDE